MDSIGVLIVFAIIGAVICARARVAGGAVVFALIALVLFIGTPVGAGLPSALSEFVNTLNQSTTPVLRAPGN
jgi:hypothetical protein